MSHKNGAYKQPLRKLPGSVLIVGGLLVDDVAVGTESIRPCCSNPVRWEQKLGGVATNIARVVAQQLDCVLVASIGDDKGGKLMSQALYDVGVTCSPIIRTGETSDRYSAVLNPNGDLFVGLADARLVEKIQWQDIQSHWPQQTPDAVLLDANLSQSCITETVTAIAELHKDTTKIHAMAVSPIKAKRWLPVADKVDVLFCNRLEAATLTALPDQSNLATLADALLNCGFAQFVITDASAEIMVQENVGRTTIPVDSVQVEQNVNGAGDAMAGATLIQLLQGEPLAQAIATAGLSAANAVLRGDVTAPSL